MDRRKKRETEEIKLFLNARELEKKQKIQPRKLFQVVWFTVSFQLRSLTIKSCKTSSSDPTSFAMILSADFSWGKKRNDSQK